MNEWTLLWYADTTYSAIQEKTFKIVNAYGRFLLLDVSFFYLFTFSSHKQIISKLNNVREVELIDLLISAGQSTKAEEARQVLDPGAKGHKIIRKFV